MCPIRIVLVVSSAFAVVKVALTATRATTKVITSKRGINHFAKLREEVIYASEL